jgi:hypothetical protein
VAAESGDSPPPAESEGSVGDGGVTGTGGMLPDTVPDTPPPPPPYPRAWRETVLFVRLKVVRVAFAITLSMTTRPMPMSATIMVYSMSAWPRRDFRVHSCLRRR